MTVITDDLDVEDPGVRGEMIVESADQLSVVHCGGETPDEDACLVRWFWEISAPKGDGAYRLVCQLRRGGGRGRQLCLRDGWGRGDERVEAGAPSSGAGIDELFGHTVLSCVDVDGGGRWESEENNSIYLLFPQDFSGLVRFRTWLALSLIK